MENTCPYWKVIVSLVISLTTTCLIVIAGYKLLILFMPFVIGWVIASIANPIVCWLESRVRIVKKWGTAITIVVVLGIIVGFFYLITASIVKELSNLITDVPNLYASVEKEWEGIYQVLPKMLQRGWDSLASNFGSFVTAWMKTLSVPTVRAAGNFAKGIPNAFIGIIMVVLSAYFFISDRDEVTCWLKKVTPQSIRWRMEIMFSTLKYAVGGYFKAQLQIMAVLGGILFVGFMILGVPYAIVWAVLIAFLDFLPFFGTAITLVPWAIYKFLGGDYKMTIGLLILYVLTQLIRQLIQPKLVGDRVGLKPIPTLVFLYLGYKVGSIWGLIFAVPVGMILIDMYKANAFDYILDDVKILIKGIKSLRE